MSDTFSNAYECEDCGRDDYNSIKAMLQCPCDKRYAYELGNN